MKDIGTTEIKPFPELTVLQDTPSSDQVIILSVSQLKGLIEQATEPLINEIKILKSRMKAFGEIQDRQAEKIESLLNQEREPGKTELARAEKIKRYLNSRPDHRATFETLKGYLGVDKFLLNQAIKTLMDSSPEKYGIIRTPGDRRRRTLVMLPR